MYKESLDDTPSLTVARLVQGSIDNWLGLVVLSRLPGLGSKTRGIKLNKYKKKCCAIIVVRISDCGHAMSMSVMIL